MTNNTTDGSFKKTHQVVGANGGQLVDDLNGKIMKDAPGHDGVSFQDLLPHSFSFHRSHQADPDHFLASLAFTRTSPSSSPASNARTANRSNVISPTKATRPVRPTRKLPSTLISKRSSNSVETLQSDHMQSIINVFPGFVDS